MYRLIEKLHLERYLNSRLILAIDLVVSGVASLCALVLVRLLLPPSPTFRNSPCYGLAARSYIRSSPFSCSRPIGRSSATPRCGNRKIRRGGHRQGTPVGTDHSALPAYTAVRYAYAGSAAVRSAADPLRPDPDPGSDDYRVRPGQKQPEIPQTAPVGVGLRIKRKIGIAGHPLAKFSALQGRRVPDFRPENEKPHHRGVSGLLFRK